MKIYEKMQDEEYVGNSRVLMKNLTSGTVLEYHVNSNGNYSLLVGKNSFRIGDSLDIYYKEGSLDLTEKNVYTFEVAESRYYVDPRTQNVTDYVEVRTSKDSSYFNFVHLIVSFSFRNIQECYNPFYMKYSKYFTVDHINGKKYFNHSCNLETVPAVINIYRAYKNYQDKSKYETLFKQALLELQNTNDQVFIDLVMEKLGEEGYTGEI